MTTAAEACEALASQIEAEMGNIICASWEDPRIPDQVDTSRSLKAKIIIMGDRPVESSMPDSINARRYVEVEIWVYLSVGGSDLQHRRRMMQQVVDWGSPNGLMRAVLSDRTLGGVLDGDLTVDADGVRREDPDKLEVGDSGRWIEYILGVDMPIKREDATQ